MCNELKGTHDIVVFRQVVVTQQLILLNQRRGSGSRRGGDVCRQGARAPHPTDRVTCMETQPHHCLWERVCVCVLHLGGREPTYQFGSFTVCAVSSLINHWALWEMHWCIDPGFSVWTYRLSVYGQPYWQVLWLSDTWRALTSSCSPHTSWALQTPKAAATDGDSFECTVADKHRRGVQFTLRTSLQDLITQIQQTSRWHWQINSAFITLALRYTI